MKEKLYVIRVQHAAAAELKKAQISLRCGFLLVLMTGHHFVYQEQATSQAKADVEESIDAIEELEHELAELAEEIETVVDEVEDKWGDIATEITEIPVNPFKKDILVDIFGVAWMPYHLVEAGGKVIELPGFGA